MAPRKSRLALLAAAALLSYAGLHGRLRRYEIAEDSMEPQLQRGDYILAQARTGHLARGDIVIFRHPEDSGLELVKRVIGLPGESVTLSNGQVHINDAVLAEPWADGPARPEGAWQLGAHEVFVLGDNRADSASDSRQIGAIDEGAIGWKVAARYWPLHGIGRLPTGASSQ